MLNEIWRLFASVCIPNSSWKDYPEIPLFGYGVPIILGILGIVLYT